MTVDFLRELGRELGRERCCCLLFFFAEEAGEEQKVPLGCAAAAAVVWSFLPLRDGASNSVAAVAAAATSHECPLVVVNLFLCLFGASAPACRLLLSCAQHV